MSQKIENKRKLKNTASTLISSVKFEDIPWDKIVLGRKLMNKLVLYFANNTAFNTDTFLTQLKTLSVKYSDCDSYYGEYSLIDNTITITSEGIKNDDYFINTLVHELFHVLSFQSKLDDESSKMIVFGEALTETLALKAIKRVFPDTYPLPSYSIYLFPAIVVNKVLGEDNIKNYYSTGRISEIPNITNNEILRTLILECIGSMETLFDSSSLFGLNIMQQKKLDSSMCVEVYKRAFDVWFYNEIITFNDSLPNHKKFILETLSIDTIQTVFPFGMINYKNYPSLKAYLESKIHTLKAIVQDKIVMNSMFTSLAQATLSTAQHINIDNFINELFTKKDFSAIATLPEIYKTSLFYTTLIRSAANYNEKKVQLFDYLFSKQGLMPDYEKDEIIVATILSIAEYNASGIIKYIPTKFVKNTPYIVNLVKNNPMCYREALADKRIPAKVRISVINNCDSAKKEITK